MKGMTRSPKGVGISEVFWSGLGAFLGIYAVGWLAAEQVGALDRMMLIGSFGASAVLIYGAITSPLAQPRNLLGGHIISALIGVAVYQVLGENPALAAGVAVSFAIIAMQLTKTLHPPGGATALIAVIGSPQVHELGYLYAIVPVGLGALVMLVIALLVNNIPRSRRYPAFWV